MTEFKPAKCPSCGGSLQVPDDRERVKCMYCGNEIVVKEAIAAAVGVNLEALREVARTATQAGDHAAAMKYWQRILEADAGDAEAWFWKGMGEFHAGGGRLLTELVGDTQLMAVLAQGWTPPEDGMQPEASSVATPEE